MDDIKEDNTTYWERLTTWVSDQIEQKKATYAKFEPVIKTLGGFNPAGKWMKTFVQGVKKKRGVQAGFGAKYKKKCFCFVGSILIPTGLSVFIKFVNNLGKEKS